MPVNSYVSGTAGFAFPRLNQATVANCVIDCRAGSVLFGIHRPMDRLVSSYRCSPMLCPPALAVVFLDATKVRFAMGHHASLGAILAEGQIATSHLRVLVELGIRLVLMAALCRRSYSHTPYARKVWNRRRRHIHPSIRALPRASCRWPCLRRGHRASRCVLRRCAHRSRSWCRAC